MLIREAFLADKEYRQLFDDLKNALGARALPFVACGLCDGAADALMATLFTSLSGKGAVLCILPEEKECNRLQAQLAQYGLRTAFYTARDLTFYNITASHEYEYERIRVLWGLSQGDFDVILTTPDAALGYTISRERLAAHTLHLDESTLCDPAALAEKLVAAGYTRVELVEGPGQFALRGGIVDIYAPHLRALSTENKIVAGAAPLRIELFGDEIDRMGIFDAESQRVHTMVTGCEIPPAREVLVDAAARERLREAVEAQLKKCRDERAKEEVRAELAELELCGEVRFADKYLSLIDPACECLLSYFGAGTLTVLRGTNAIGDRLKASAWHRDETIKELLENGTVMARFAEYSRPNSFFDRFLEDAVPAGGRGRPGGVQCTQWLYDSLLHHAQRCCVY